MFKPKIIILISSGIMEAMMEKIGMEQPIGTHWLIFASIPVSKYLILIKCFKEYLPAIVMRLKILYPVLRDKNLRLSDSMAMSLR